MYIFFHLLSLFFSFCVTPFSFYFPICLSLSFILWSLCLFVLSLFSFSCSSVCLSHSKCILMCPCTITKPACLFILHRGFTLFLRYYFFVKSPRYDLPQTALHCPTLIIFSHSATLGHIDTHAHTFSHKTMCVFVLSSHWFLGVLKMESCLSISYFFLVVSLQH